MHIGMKEAVAHRVAEERAQNHEAELLAVEACRLDGRHVAGRDAVDPLDGKHALGRTAPVHIRHAEIAIEEGAVGLDVVGHLRDRGRLEPQVHLEGDGLRQRLDDRHGAQAPRERQPRLDLAGGETEAREIVAEACFHVGPQDLHGHLTAHAVIDHDRFVHLGDGRRGDGWAEFDEVFFELAAERRFHGCARLAHRERRQLVLQLGEVVGKLCPDQVAARGEELSELDVAGAEASERASHPAFARLRRAHEPRQRAQGHGRDAQQFCSGKGTGMPGGMKRTPCWASTRPVRASRRRSLKAEAMGRCRRISIVAGTLPEMPCGSSNEVGQRVRGVSCVALQPRRRCLRSCEVRRRWLAPWPRAGPRSRARARAALTAPA